MRVLTEDQKERARERARAHYYANREKKKAQSAAWREANPEKCQTYYKRYQESNPDKHKARWTVWNAKVAGKLVVPDHCEVCEVKADIIDAHHDDYTKPLDVRWLCRDCHATHHRVYNEGDTL